MRDRTPSLLVVALAGLVAYLVSCLVKTQKETTDSIQQVSDRITSASTASLKEITQTYSQTFTKMTSEVTGLAEVLMLGRDSPSPNENSSMSRTESETLSEPEIDLSLLPASARLAAEEESLLRNEMPWQSSTQQDVLDS